MSQATRNFSTNLNNPQESQLNICNWLHSQFIYFHGIGETEKAQSYLTCYYDAQAQLVASIDKAMAEAIRMVRNGS